MAFITASLSLEHNTPEARQHRGPVHRTILGLGWRCFYISLTHGSPISTPKELTIINDLDVVTHLCHSYHYKYPNSVNI
jgi:hypothetical protein